MYLTDLISGETYDKCHKDHISKAFLDEQRKRLDSLFKVFDKCQKECGPAFLPSEIEISYFRSTVAMLDYLVYRATTNSEGRNVPH